MTMRFVDGFDHYDVTLEKWDVQTGGTFVAEIVQSEGRFTPGALRIGGNSFDGNLIKFIPDGDEYIAGFAMKFPVDCLFDLQFKTVSSGSLVGSMTVNPPDITLKDASGSVVATALGAVTAGPWKFLEFRCKQHPTLGEVELRESGITIASATGLNTGSVAISEVNWNSAPTSDDIFVDDLYVLDTTGSAPQNTFLGDTRVTVLRPKANGTNNNFTPTGAANNFQAVDETLSDQDATFVEAGQLGAKEDYDNQAFSDLGLAPGTIFAVQVVNSTKKTDAGRLDYRDKMVVAGTSFDNGTDVISTSGTYKMTTFVRDTDPSDDGAWTEAKVAAVGSGIEITFREM